MFPAWIMANDMVADSVQVTSIESPEDARYKATLTTDTDGRSIFVLTDTAGCVVYSHGTEVADTTATWPWDLSLKLVSNSPQPKAKKGKKFKTTMFNSVLIGLTHPLDAPAGIKNYWEVHIPDVLGVQYRATNSTFLSVGIGIGGNFYKVDGKGRHMEQHSKAIVMMPNAEGMTDVESLFSVYNVVVPFTFEQNIVRGFGFSLSAAASFSAFAFASTSYTLGNIRYKEKYKDLQLRPVTADFTASLGWNTGISLYVKYSPWSKFRFGFGPQFKELSFGLRLSL